MGDEKTILTSSSLIPALDKGFGYLRAMERAIEAGEAWQSPATKQYPEGRLLEGEVLRKEHDRYFEAWHAKLKEYQRLRGHEQQDEQERTAKQEQGRMRL